MMNKDCEGQLLGELKVRPGDVVECVQGSYYFTKGKTYTVADDGMMPDDYGPKQWGNNRWPQAPLFVRASTAPEPWTIFNNREAHGLLTYAQRAEFQAWDGGIAFLSHKEWQQTFAPVWAYSSIYRAIPKPALVPDVIPWAAMLPELKWCARSENGAIVAGTGSAVKSPIGWYAYPGRTHRIDQILPVTIGTMDWKDSLQQRPENA